MAQIGIKFKDINYALWSLIVEMYISGIDKLEYINEDFPYPLLIDSTYRQW